MLQVVIACRGYAPCVRAEDRELTYHNLLLVGLSHDVGVLLNVVTVAGWLRYHERDVGLMIVLEVAIVRLLVCTAVGVLT